MQGLGAFMTESLWDSGNDFDVVVPDGADVAGGFDGSRSGDWTAIRLETLAGHRFTPTYGPDSRPAVWRPEEWPDGRIPRGEVDAAMDEVMRRYAVSRMYCDPRHFETQIDVWATKYGEEVVVEWPTNSIERMFNALVRYREDLAERLTTHSDDAVMKTHAMAARKVAKTGDRFILGKPSENQKIDMEMADVLAHEAAADARAAGWVPKKPKSKMVVMN